MRKTATLSLAVAAIMVISAAVVFSHPGWRGGRPWRGEGTEPVTLEGKITDAERPLVKMEADSKEYILHLGPVWYWQEKGYTLEKDQTVEVTGVVKDIDGVLNVYPQTIKTNGESIELADEDCVPVWTGRRGGRGPGFGRGYGQCGYGTGYGWHGHGYMHDPRGYGRGHMYGRGGHGSRGCGW